jgi:hypothetical protein
VQVFDENSFPDQEIAPRQQLAIPYRFQVPEGTLSPPRHAATHVKGQG